VSTNLLFDIDSVETGQVVKLPEVEGGRERRNEGNTVVIHHHHHIRGRQHAHLL
jgi:hypothetical protein